MTLPTEAVCCGCNRLYNVASGMLVEGWERALFFNVTDYICPACKEPVISNLNNALAATL